MFFHDDYNLKSLIIKSESPIILDIGANIGAFSILANSLFKKAKILAYEPEESNFKIIKKNINYNNIQEKIFPYRMALSTKEGEQEFFYQNMNMPIV